MKLRKRQQGVATIVVAMSMVAIGGMVQIALEGSRMIQEKHRLADATEAATLAVSIANSSEHSESTALARAYVERYLGDEHTVNRVNVIRSEGQEEIDGNKLYYVQYEVEADAEFDSWFNFVGMQDAQPVETRAVGNEAMAKTYQLPSDLDLVYIADFSGSMNTYWGGGKSRLDVLKEQVSIISQDLLSSSAVNAGYAHRIGFVPYNLRTQEYIQGEKRCVTELDYESYQTRYDTVRYSDIDWYRWGKQSSNTLYNCKDNSYYCPGFSNRTEAKAIDNVFDYARYETGYSSSRWPDPRNYVDISATVANWRYSKTATPSLHPLYSDSGTRLFSNGMCGSDARFETLNLSRDFPAIDNMRADGGTAVYQGVIRGAQILADGAPDTQDQEQIDAYHERAQMLLILSDGKEDPFKTTFSDLVNAGLCQNIRQHFSAHERPLYIGVIGIDFNASGQTGFRNCADDIIDVDNSHELQEKIQELIQKGAATSGVSRLYDKSL